MSTPTRALFVQWLVLFSLVSLGHSAMLNRSLSVTSGFHSDFDFDAVLFIGLIFLVMSLVLSLPALLLTAFVIRYSHISRKLLIQINAIAIIFGVAAFLFISHLTASFMEGLLYVSTYFGVFMLVIHFYYFMMKREKQDNRTT